MKLKIYEGCEKQLRDVEERLVEVYGSVVGELEVCEDGVNEEVIGLLKEAERRRVERIELCGHHLPFLPEAFGKLHGLAFLNPSHNHLDVYPDSIAGLLKLEELDASSNLLVKLPDSVDCCLI